MLKEMRRSQQLMKREQTEEILEHGTSGVLSICLENGYGYGVPMSYVYKNGKIYFHCAKEGQKLDGIKNNDKVTFTVIGQDKIVPENYTTHYKSAMAFGKISVVEDDAMRRKIMEYIVEKYSPDYASDAVEVVESKFDILCILELDVEQITGKMAPALARMENKQ